MLGGVPFGESDLTECPNQWHSVGAVLGRVMAAVIAVS